MVLFEIELCEVTVERQGDRGVFSGIWTKKLRSVIALIALTLCRGTVPVLTLICNIGQFVLVTFLRAHSCFQQVAQRFQMCTLEFRHCVGSISVVKTPSRTTHRSTHELFNDRYLQCRLSVILRKVVVQCIEQTFGTPASSSASLASMWQSSASGSAEWSFGERAPRGSSPSVSSVSPPGPPRT